MKSDTMRAVDEAALPRPWKWTDGALLWNEEVDHEGANWPVSPENRAAIESAMNHMPALITLVAACERRRFALGARREFGSRAYQENPFSALSAEFEEFAALLDGNIRIAEHDLDAALIDIHAVNVTSSTGSSAADGALSNALGETVAVQGTWRAAPPTVNEVRVYQWWWHRTRSGGVTIGPSLISLDVDRDGCLYVAEVGGDQFEPDDWGTEWALCLPPMDVS
jgi:hypothetical protein